VFAQARYPRDLPEAEIEEKRYSRRSPCRIEARGTLLAPADSLEHSELFLRGIAENVSRGGVGLFVDQCIPVDSLVRCEFIVSEQAAIPSLLKVRWALPQDGTSRCKIGLQFLV
jgi:PilZ domain